MAVNHWSQMRQRITLIGIDAIILIPVIVLLFQFTKVWAWLICLTWIITVIIIEKVFKYQISYALFGLRKWLFGSHKKTKRASKNMEF